MSDNANTILYPSVALAALVVGAVGGGLAAGLTVVQSLGVLVAVIVLVGVVGASLAIHHRHRKRHTQALLAESTCPSCGAEYKLEDVTEPRLERYDAFDDTAGLLVQCGRCGARSLWSEKGKLIRLMGDDVELEGDG
jgi:endogenous inhibitor of DNA gyrase (YacG/DUF329 family)